MSEPDLPPPVPPLSAPAPVPEGPVILPYAEAHLPRPGLLTAMGVLGIVFGGMGILASAAAVAQSVLYIVLSRILPQQVATVTTGPSAPSVVNPSTRIPAGPMVAHAVAEVVLLGLAIYLLVCGIWVLRDRASSRRHLLRYAKLKIAAAVIGAATSAWSTYAMQSALLASIPNSSGPWVALVVGLATAVFWLVVATVYPVAALIVMHLRSVKQYYGTMAD